MVRFFLEMLSRRCLFSATSFFGFVLLCTLATTADVEYLYIYMRTLCTEFVQDHLHTA